ncbi:MAG TPA: hypothetical protein GX000_05015 [Actinomyces sp.]|nr:hypothetical protein [Acidobacteriota bacterium]HHT40981.1 hypothetical protein [Actinomyces sp.]
MTRSLPRIMSLFAAALIATGLTACSPSTPPEDPPTESQESAQTEVTEEETTEDATTAAEEPEESNRDSVNADVYAIPDDTVYVDDGRKGYWFANEDHSIQCTMITENLDYAPFVACRVYPAFEIPAEDVASADCPAGQLSGTQATLREDGPQMGSCQSDVPIQKMCLEGGAGAASFCETNWFDTPVLPENMDIAAGDFTCHLEGNTVNCSHSNGQKLQVSPGN